MVSLTCEIKNKKQVNGKKITNIKKLTDEESKLIVASRGGDEWNTWRGLRGTNF